MQRPTGSIEFTVTALVTVLATVLATVLSACGPSASSGPSDTRPFGQESQSNGLTNNNNNNGARTRSTERGTDIEPSSIILSPPSIPLAIPGSEPTSATGLQTTSSQSTVLPTAPLPLCDDAAIQIAQQFLAALRSPDADENYAEAAEFWTGYPYPPGERAHRLQTFLANNSWLADNDIKLSVVRAWSFQPETAMTVVAISDKDGRGTTSLLLNNNGDIERLESPLPPIALPTINDTSVVFRAIPTEGYAVAYIDTYKLPDQAITIDHDTLTTTVDLSTIDAELLRGATLIFSSATPEFPAVTTMRLQTTGPSGLR